MRMISVTMVVLVACSAAGEDMATQAVAGPGGVTVMPRDTAGQLAVSWTADPAAVRYQVLQAQGGAAPALVASVFDSSGGAPATSWIAGVAPGDYCYAVSAGYSDGSSSARSLTACATATGSTSTRSRRFYPSIIASDGTWSQSDGHGVPCLLSSGVSTTGLYLALPYDEGDRITGLSLDVKGGGDTQVVSFSVTSELYNTPITGSSLLSLVDDRERSGAEWSVLAMPSFTPSVLTGDRFLYLGVTHNGGGYCIGSVRMFYDRPSGP